MVMTKSDHFDFPYHIDGRGRTAETDEDDHIRDLIYQVLFTNPGERVNRPDFGCGIGQLVFMPNSAALAAATQFLVQGSLTRWLDDVIAVHRVEVVAMDNALTVGLVFTKRSTGEERDERFLSPWHV
jgi:phage baseplate assembly protein W